MSMATWWLLQAEESQASRGLSEAQPRPASDWSGGGDRMKDEWVWE